MLFFNLEKFPECIREISKLLELRDFAITVVHVLITAHKACQYVDKEALHTLEAKLAVLNTESESERSFLLKGSAFLFLGDCNNAVRAFKSCLSINNSNISAMNGLGWESLLNNLDEKWFSQALTVQSSGIEPLLGKCLALRCSANNLAVALDAANSLIALCPRFEPAHEQKMLILFEMKAWEELKESNIVLLSKSPQNIDANFMRCMYILCKESSNDSIVECLNGLFQSIRDQEPSNWQLLLQVIEPMARLCRRNSK